MAPEMENEQWWDVNIRKAGDNLVEYFERGIEYPTYQDAFHVAQNCLLLGSQLLTLDPNIGGTDRKQEQIWHNIIKVQSLARRLFEGTDTVVEAEIIAGKFVLAHFYPVGELAAHPLMACRFALSSILVVNASVMIPEIFAMEGPEAWCLAMHAYNAIQNLGEEDDDETPKQAYWVTVNELLVGRSEAHRINNTMAQMGGDSFSSN